MYFMNGGCDHDMPGVSVTKAFISLHVVMQLFLVVNHGIFHMSLVSCLQVFDSGQMPNDKPAFLLKEIARVIVGNVHSRSFMYGPHKTPGYRA